MYSVLTVLVLTMYRCTMYIVLSLTVKCRISYSVTAWYRRVLFLTVGTAFPPLAVRMGSFYSQSWVICAVMDILFYICVWWAWLSSTIFPALRPKFPCTPSKKIEFSKSFLKTLIVAYFVCAENFTVL